MHTQRDATPHTCVCSYIASLTECVQMSTRRHLNRDGIAHANADSVTHERHVEQRARLREVEWVPATVADTSATEFRLQAHGLAMPNGLYYVGVGETERSVGGAEFEDVCAAVNWNRRWNTAVMQRRKKVPEGTPGSLNGFVTQSSKVRRKRSAFACEEFIVNFAPWQMTFLNEQLRLLDEVKQSSESREEFLRAMVDDARIAVVSRFRSFTGRDCVGSYVHFDSNKIHVAVIHSRVSAENALVGEAALRTVGPWSVAQNRITNLGLCDEGDHRLRENLEKFAGRHGGEKKPLDIELHDVLDERFSDAVAKMGESATQRFEKSKQSYRRWKTESRQKSVLRSSHSLKSGYATLRLLLPLLPPKIRAAVSMARGAAAAFTVVQAFLDELQPATARKEVREVQHEVAI